MVDRERIIQAAYDIYWETLDEHGVEPYPKAAMAAAVDVVMGLVKPELDRLGGPDTAERVERLMIAQERIRQLEAELEEKGHAVLMYSEEQQRQRDDIIKLRDENETESHKYRRRAQDAEDRAFSLERVAREALAALEWIAPWALGPNELERRNVAIKAISAVLSRERAPIPITDEMVRAAQCAYYQSAGITVRQQMNVSREHLRAALEEAINPKVHQ